MENTLRMPSSSSLLDGFRSLITPDVVTRASSTFGESEAAMTKGLGALMPTVFGALANRAGDRWFISQVFDMVRDPAADSGILGNISSFFGSGTASTGTGLGSRFISMLFGNNVGSVGSALSNLSGLKPSTAASLIGMAGPLALGYLANLVRRERLDATGLSDLLLGQRSSILSYVPNTLTNFVGTASRTGDVAYRTSETTVRRASGWRWLLLAGLGLLLLWGLSSLIGRRTPTTRATGPVATVGDFVSRSLPTGANLRFLRDGIEGKLIAFIQDPTQTVDRAGWFEFDRLLFETGSPVLRPESRDQLHNIAEILRAYPNVHVKVGGYTDSTGDPTSNLQLSQNRANSVRQALIDLGISPSRLTAEGYGETHPVAGNVSEAGRAQNRRVALKVTAK
jgi:outer membrane protein OmpA-like peptidoglycan-associated protein